MQLEDTIRKIIEEECEDYFFGIADLSLTKKLVIGQEESLIAEYSKAISIGITMLPILQKKSLMKNESSKTKHYDYDRIIQQLNLITTRLSNLLQHKGYKALPIHVTDKSDDQGIYSAFSHELVANLAGLGWIGNDSLLITSEVGSDVLWSTVLIDAPLKAAEKPFKENNDL